MRKAKFISVWVLLLLICAGCSLPKAEINEKLAIPVQIISAQAEIQEAYLYNIGLVTSINTVKYSFKSGGTMGKIYVAAGDEVQPGTPLALLDRSDLKLAVDAAQAQMEAAQAQYDKAMAGATPEDKRNAELNLIKAQDAFQYAEETYQRLQKLYEVGGVADNDLKRAKLEYDIRASELKQAQELNDQAQKGAREEDIAAAQSMFNQSQVNYHAKQKMFDEALLQAVGTGTVVDVLYEEGEVVAPGYPAVVVRGETQAVTVGLTQAEIAQTQIGQDAWININSQTVAGRVTALGEVLDPETRTYEVEITLLEGEYRLGTIAKTHIITGQESGFWLPIDCIRFAGEDYVYLVRDDIVVYQPITRLELRGNRVRVEGLQAGDQVVISNAGQIKTGDKVQIVE